MEQLKQDVYSVYSIHALTSNCKDIIKNSFKDYFDGNRINTFLKINHISRRPIVL